MDNPIVALAGCAEYEEGAVDRALQQVLAAVGGLESLLPDQGVVLLKPNFLVPRKVELAVTTHPRFIAAVARAVRARHRGRLLLGDGPALGSSNSVARKIGLPELLDGLDVEIVDFEERIPVTGGGGFGPLLMARPLVEADAVISLPKVKTHGQMYFTCGVKNLFGAFVGFDKPRFHLTAGRDYATFARLLLEACRRVGPVLTLADGVVGMEGNGPSSGEPRVLGLIAGSREPVALDSVLIDLLGFPASAVPVQMEARRQALTGAWLEQVELRGDPPERFRVGDWQPARQEGYVDVAGLPPALARPMRNALTSRPVIDHARCTRCGLCAEQCAAGALDLRPRRRQPAGPTGSDQSMNLDLTRCIRCYCCQEVCPERAITVGEGWLLELTHRWERLLRRMLGRVGR